MNSFVIKQDGSLWATGSNEFGELGYGDKDTSPRETFVQVISAEVEAVATRLSHTILLKTDGSVWATGQNNCGQLGDGTMTDRTEFKKIIDGGVKAVAVGKYHSMVLKTVGSVWATGDNQYGQLGDGTTSSKANFVKVLSGQ